MIKAIKSIRWGWFLESMWGGVLLFVALVACYNGTIFAAWALFGR